MVGKWVDKGNIHGCRRYVFVTCSIIQQIAFAIPLRLVAVGRQNEGEWQKQFMVKRSFALAVARCWKGGRKVSGFVPEKR